MQGADTFEEINQELKSIEDVRKVYKIAEINGDVLLPESKITDVMKETSPYILNNEKDDFIEISNTRLYTIGDDNLHLLTPLLEEGTIDHSELEKSNGVLVINNTYVHDINTDTAKLVQGFNL